MTPEETKNIIQDAIHAFAEGDLTRNTLQLFKKLGYNTDRQAPMDVPDYATFREFFIVEKPFNEERAKVSDWKHVDLLFQLTKEEVEQQISLFDTGRVDQTIMEAYLFFAIELTGDSYTRTELSQITREVNRLFPMPVMVLFKYGSFLTLSVINRRIHKRDEHKDVLEKVTQIKDISIQEPHRAHIEILFDLSFDELKRRHKVTNFVDLHNAWQKTLDTKELNKIFYQKLFNWYLWALKEVKFPQIRPERDLIDDKVHQSESLIRLLTRLLFVWFMKEKGLIGAYLFNSEELKAILKGFNGKESDQTIFYKAILQNLFFATLNQPIEKRKVIDKGFNPTEYGDPLVYRFDELFKEPDRVPEYFRNIPFLNGGLFECLDQKKDDENPQEIRLDGFSTKKSKQVHFPDKFFFGDYPGIDLSSDYDDKKKKNLTVYGIIDILNSYKFTIEESTPIEKEIALDPELLGKVFENLLASYNPETQTTARKQTGSFYTPPEIVNYMVDESLIQHLKSVVDDEKRLRELFSYEDISLKNPFNASETKALIQSIDNCKILDPACGSGAFPMGALQKMTHVLHKLDPENKIWFEMVIGNLPPYMQAEARRKLEKENWNYVRKLGIIQQCLYGVDIQPIAVQISKLRFFISLLVDQEGKPGEPNMGFEPLPNLDFKLVAANTLIPAPENEAILAYERDAVENFEKLSNEYFSAISKRKTDIKNEIRSIIQKIVAANHLVVTRWKEKAKREFNSASPSKRKKHNQEVNKYQKALDLWNTFPNLYKNESVGFFETRFFFPQVKEGFDVVIGNPPYIDIKGLPTEDVKLYFKIFSTAENRMNLYAVFIERGISLLNRTGILTYIHPNSLLVNESYKKIRKLILNGVEKLIKLPDGIFESASVETMLLFTKQISNNKKIAGLYFSNNEKIDFSDLNFNYFSRDEWVSDSESRFNIFVSEDITRLLKKIQSNTKPLESFVLTSLGITPYDKYKGHSESLIRNQGFHSSEKLSDLYVPLSSGKSIHSYYIDQEVDKYLKYGDWLGAPRERKFFENPKIIVRQILSGNELKIIAAYSETPKYFTQIGFSLISQTESAEDLKFLVGLLNSKLMSFYHKAQFLDSEKVLFQKILIANCRKLPIKQSNRKELFVELVEEIISVKKLNPHADTTALENRIDELVFKLYDLTYEEVKVIVPDFWLSEEEYDNIKMS